MNTIQINDIIFHYQKIGTGKPVVLVHGNGEDHTIFKTEIEQLVSAGYCVYAPDSRGHGATGASNPPVSEFHYTDMSDDIYAFIQALHLEKPAYYGHSDGGIIGLLLELRHPGTVGIMAISGTNLSPDGLDESFVAECREMYEKSPDPQTALMMNKIPFSRLGCSGIVADLEPAVRCQMQWLFDTGQHLRIPVEILLTVVQRIIVFRTTEMRILIAEMLHGVVSAVQRNADAPGVLTQRIRTVFKQCCKSAVFQSIDLVLKVDQCSLDTVNIIFIDRNPTGIMVAFFTDNSQICGQRIHTDRFTASSVMNTELL